MSSYSYLQFEPLDYNILQFLLSMLIPFVLRHVDTHKVLMNNYK